MEKVYTIDELATNLKFHPNTVRRWINEGILKATYVGGVYRITETQLNEFLNRGKK